MQLSQNPLNNILVFGIVLQALIFTIIFFRTRSKTPGIILGYYELMYCLGYSIILLHFAGFEIIYTYLHGLLLPFFSLFPVLFYLYIKKLIRKELTKKNLLHFVFPAILFITNIITWGLLPFNDLHDIIIENNTTLSDNPLQKILVTNHTIIYPLLISIQPFIYIVLFIIEIKYLHEDLKKEYADLKGINLKWAVKAITIFSILFIISFFINKTTYFFAFVLFVNIFIGVEAIYYHLSLLIHFTKQEEADEKKLKEPKYKSSTLSEKYKNNLYNQLIDLMEQERPYLHQDIRLSTIAQNLETNRQYISQVINEKGMENFYNFINAYRIQEFIKYIEQQDHKHTTFEEIAFKAGFKSKSSFYTAFKKIKGCSPREYLKINQ